MHCSIVMLFPQLSKVFLTAGINAMLGIVSQCIKSIHLLQQWMWKSLEFLINVCEDGMRFCFRILQSVKSCSQQYMLPNSPIYLWACLVTL